MKELNLLSFKEFNHSYYIELIWQKSKAELRAEAARGYLGLLWWILDPILYMSAFYVVFAHFFQRGDENYVMFLLTGLIVWKWFHSSTIAGASSLMSNSGLMNLVYLPKIIFPLTVITVNTVKFIIIMAIFLAFYYIVSMEATFVWFMLPLIICLQLIFIMGVACCLSAIIPFIPDLRIIIDNIMMLFFFLSGIFFDVNIFPDNLKTILLLNPMAVLISMYRQIIFYGIMPDLNQIVLLLVVSATLFGSALILFSRYDRTYPKIIN